MGVFDQAARFAARADPDPVVRRLLAPTGLASPFREWLDTRTVPLPGGPDRTANLVAALDHPAGPTLVVLEFQARHDPDKLEVTLEEAAALRCRARHGGGKYRVLTALVYLTGRCPDAVLDMTVPGGFGTRHAPLVWDVAGDDAAAALDAEAAGAVSWGILFWVPLMAGGGDEAVIGRWKDAVARAVPDPRGRDGLISVALVFAELAGRRVEWLRGLEEFMLTESEVVNGWIRRSVDETRVAERRQFLLDVLETRFPGAAPTEVVQTIGRQDSPELLHDWIRAALRAFTFDQFLEVLRR